MGRDETRQPCRVEDNQLSNELRRARKSREPRGVFRNPFKLGMNYAFSRDFIALGEFIYDQRKNSLRGFPLRDAALLSLSLSLIRAVDDARRSIYIAYLARGE